MPPIDSQIPKDEVQPIAPEAPPAATGLETLGPNLEVRPSAESNTQQSIAEKPAMPERIPETTDISADMTDQAVDVILKGPEKDFQEIESIAGDDPFSAAEAFHEKQSKVIEQMYPEEGGDIAA